MSYILDALRRADAERQRGAVPGLHAQPLSAALADCRPDRPAAQRRRWQAGGWAAAALLALGAVLAWRGAGPPGPLPTLPVASVPPPASPQQAAAAPRQTAPQAAPQAAPLPLPQPQPLLELPPPPQPPPQPQPAPQPAPQRAAPTVRLAAPAVPASPLATAPPATSRAAPAAPAAPPRLPTLAELPEATRRELPALVVGGSMYADQAPLRIVILNGQVVHEGDRLAPELRVQQIRLKSVVLDFRGQAFEIGF